MQSNGTKKNSLPPKYVSLWIFGIPLETKKNVQIRFPKIFSAGPVFAFLKNASHRLGMPQAADITKARALATQRGKHLKLNISYRHELISWEMSVYFDNIGLVL